MQVSKRRLEVHALLIRCVQLITSVSNIFRLFGCRFQEDSHAIIMLLMKDLKSSKVNNTKSLFWFALWAAELAISFPGMDL